MAKRDEKISAFGAHVKSPAIFPMAVPFEQWSKSGSRSVGNNLKRPIRPRSPSPNEVSGESESEEISDEGSDLGHGSEEISELTDMVNDIILTMDDMNKKLDKLISGTTVECNSCERNFHQKTCQIECRNCVESKQNKKEMDIVT